MQAANCRTGHFAWLPSAIALAVSVVSLSLAGCGGGGTQFAGGSSTSSGAVITRDTDSKYSADAKALAVTTATTPFLSADSAATYDSDLTVIRSKDSTVADIHVRPAYSLTQLLVTVPAGASYLSRWQAGNLTTREAALDTLLQKYSAIGVTELSPTSAGTAFIVTFGESLNMPALATVFQNAGTSLAGASANQIVGNSASTITVTTSADGGRSYTFLRGSGDCPAGCIAHEVWLFVVSPDGKNITETKSIYP